MAHTACRLPPAAPAARRRRRLRRLPRRLCSAAAAWAGGHFQIAKGAAGKGKRVATRITQLLDEARQEEIARMLSGATITAEARAAAGKLLQGAG